MRRAAAAKVAKLDQPVPPHEKIVHFQVPGVPEKQKKTNDTQKKASHDNDQHQVLVLLLYCAMMAHCCGSANKKKGKNCKWSR